MRVEEAKVGWEINNPSKGKIGMLTMILRVGVLLLFPLYIRGVLNAFNLAQTQLVPNA